jgi:hypothetical protein
MIIVWMPFPPRHVVGFLLPIHEPGVLPKQHGWTAVKRRQSNLSISHGQTYTTPA